jgi:putative membrane protein
MDQPPELSKTESAKPSGENPAQPAESRVREYLSNERTYLSWMRTAISLLGVGVILARIRAFQPPLARGPGTTWQLGLIFAIVGVITVFLATQHYLAIRREIADDTAGATGRWVILFSIVVLLLGSGIVYYAFSYSPSELVNSQ